MALIFKELMFDGDFYQTKAKKKDRYGDHDIDLEGEWRNKIITGP